MLFKLYQKVQIASKKYWKTIEIVIFLILAAFAICYKERLMTVNFDDIAAWEMVNTNSFSEYVFNTAAYKFRPVANLVMYFFWSISLNSPLILGYYLILLHGIMSIIVFLIARRMSRSDVISIGIALLYQVSRFSYYQMASYLGIMETCATLFSLLLFYTLWKNINEPQPDRRDWIKPLVFYFLAVFSHERFIVLFLAIIYAVFVSERKTRRRSGICITVLCSIVFIIIRGICLGNRAWDGTGGTRIQDTFSFRQAIDYCFKQVFYLFGWNVDHQNMNGLNWADYNCWIYAAVIILDISIAGIIILSLSGLNKSNGKKFLKNVLLFFLFTALCIGCSSVTIRIELRWIYISYIVVLLYIGSLWPDIKACKDSLRLRILPNIWSAVFLMLFCSAFAADFQLRGYWGNMFYHWVKNTADSLYQVLAENEEKIQDGQILIIGPDADEEFLSEVQRYINSNNPDIAKSNCTVNTVANIREVDVDNSLKTVYLVYEDTYLVDVTEYYETYVKEAQVFQEGWYRDGWVCKTAHMELYTNELGDVTLQLYTPATPDDSWKDHTGRIYVNGELYTEFIMDSQLEYIDLKVPQNEKVEISIENDFTDSDFERDGVPMYYAATVVKNE